MLRGGFSDPRTASILKILNLIGIRERADSGVPDIFATWEQRKLGDLADIVGGGTPSTNKSEYWDREID